MKDAANCDVRCEVHTFVNNWLFECVSACCMCVGQGNSMVVIEVSVCMCVLHVFIGIARLMLSRVASPDTSHAHVYICRSSCTLYMDCCCVYVHADCMVSLGTC